MLEKLRRLHREEKGQTIVLFALTTCVLIGCAFGFMQFAQVKYAGQQVQAALDSAVLSGAAEQVTVITSYTDTGQTQNVLINGGPSFFVQKIFTPNKRQEIWMNDPVYQSNLSGNADGVTVATTQARTQFFYILNQNHMGNYGDLSSATLTLTCLPYDPDWLAENNVSLATAEADPTDYPPYQMIKADVTVPIKANLAAMAINVLGGGSANQYINIHAKSQAVLK